MPIDHEIEQAARKAGLLKALDEFPADVALAAKAAEMLREGLQAGRSDKPPPGPAVAGDA